MFFRRQPRSNAPPDAKFMADLRHDLLRRYEHRLSQKLAGKEPVNLRKIPSDIGSTDEMMTLKAEHIPTAMLDLFNQANGRLLLTGVPGAGKTTLLLQLAEALINRITNAEKEAEDLAKEKKVEYIPKLQPLPVLLNLASWRSEFETIQAWLEQVLHLELSANRRGADRIRHTVPLILLLDGLDEVAEADRPSCLAAIGEYGAVSTRQFAVSCRREELKALEQHIPANIYLPIEVVQLTPEQIENQLTAWAFIQPEAKPLLQGIRHDKALLEALRTPFFLNTAQMLFASGKRWKQFGFSKTDDVQVREKEVLERFIENALKDGWRTHSPDEVRHWLAFLASRMNREGLVVFELRHLQYGDKKLSMIEIICAGMLSFIVNGLLTAVLVATLAALLVGGGVGLLFAVAVDVKIMILAGFIFGLLGSIVEVLAGKMLLEIARTSFFLSLIGVSASLISDGLLGRAIGGSIVVISGLYFLYLAIKERKHKILLIYTNDAIDWNLKEFGPFFLVYFLLAFSPIWFVGIIVTLILIFGEMPEYDTISALKLLGIGTLGCLAVGLIFGLRDFIVVGRTYLKKALHPYQHFASSAKNLHFSILQHWHLRYLLQRQGLLPKDLAHFLNDIADRHLMEWEGELKKDGKGEIIPNQKANGATWRFRH
ncbi:MAG TPA: hypothetical protein PK228_02395, partial [Saprospiraceae bacterium]|nr:hypothetical protein [Saprospiraceae bacterium]